MYGRTEEVYTKFLTFLGIVFVTKGMVECNMLKTVSCYLRRFSFGPNFISELDRSQPMRGRRLGI